MNLKTIYDFDVRTLDYEFDYMLKRSYRDDFGIGIPSLLNKLDFNFTMYDQIFTVLERVGFD